MKNVTMWLRGTSVQYLGSGPWIEDEYSGVEPARDAKFFILDRLTLYYHIVTSF